jgi:cytochrome c553
MQGATVFFLLGLIFCADAKAEAPAIDLELGEEINETCAGCHGEYGQGSIDGEYPRLAGLTAGYIARQLRNFKQRKRINIPMLPYCLHHLAVLAAVHGPDPAGPVDQTGPAIRGRDCGGAD